MTNDEELRSRLTALEERNAELEARIAEVTEGVAYDPGSANREHKDRLFRFIFGRAENRQWALDLYNAVAGRDYDDPGLIVYNTIEDALYLGVRNDVSFLISAQMVLWEHQSTWNPNMPMRFFIYGARLYEAYISSKDSKYSIYSETLQKVPKPRCICFYNGTRAEPDRQVLRLSDAFREEPGRDDGEPGDFEARVTVLNVNYGHNAALMEACEPLREYSWLVDAIRRHNKACEDLDEAVDRALEEMPDDFLIKEFLVRNRAEVRGMVISEWNQQVFMARYAEENRLKGEVIGENRRSNEIAINMLRAGDSVQKVASCCGLGEDEVRSLREGMLARV